jgi:hypothetical protein
VIRNCRDVSTPKSIRGLLAEGIVQEHTLEARNGRAIPLYCSKPLDSITGYGLAMAMFPDGYFCNLSSIYYHSLTNQVPNVVYICHETIGRRSGRAPAIPSKTKIRNAFIKPPRHTRYILDFHEGEVVVLDRERGSDYGTSAIRRGTSLYPKGARVTCIERALIDAVVSPQYNGGVASIPEYFLSAQKLLNVNKLLDIYRKLRFVYPYAQSIGFFLERAGMKRQAAKVRSAYPPRHQFYVDHSAKSSWRYDKRWMLYYPRGW